MSRQIILVGTVPNDGTGDPLRDAMIKVNNNFADLYVIVPTDPSGNPVQAAPVNDPHFTGDPQVPTPPAGDHDQSIANTAWVVDLLTAYAKLASPIFTGDPQAPDPPPNDNDQSLATTKWVQDFVHDQDLSGLAPIDSPQFTGDPQAPTPDPGDNDTSIATTAFVNAAIIAAPAIIGAAGSVVPQGRLTLQSQTPVMTTTAAAASVLFYTPYTGNRVPIFDGTNFIAKTFAAEIFVNIADTSKNPTAIAASKVNDWFIWDDGGTLRLSHGPDWSSDTVRSAGTQLVRVNGLWLNNVAITNGLGAAMIAAQRGTYVGTTRSSATGFLQWVLGTAALGGGAAILGVWNCYNRVSMQTLVRDSTSSWAYQVVTIADWTPANHSNNNRVSFVAGLAEDSYLGSHYGACKNDGNSAAYIAIGLDVTNAVAVDSTWGGIYVANGPGPCGMSSLQSGAPVLGYHFIQAIELPVGGPGTSGASTYFGQSAYQGLTFVGRM